MTEKITAMCSVLRFWQ